MADESKRCEWCGLSAEHESRVCVLRDDATYRMTLDLNAAPLTEQTLNWIKTQIEEAAATHLQPSIEVTIRHIGNPRPQQVEGAKS